MVNEHFGKVSQNANEMFKIKVGIILGESVRRLGVEVRVKKIKNGIKLLEE